MTFRTGYNKLTFWTLILTGILLWLTGIPLAGYNYNNTYPYLAIGVFLIALGIFMVAVSAIKRMTLRRAQIIIGLSGQFLFGLVIFGITSVPVFAFSPFNFHTYSIVLGVIGIALSLESIITLSKYKQNQVHE